MPRIYAVETETELTMVKANSQGQALSHIAKGKFHVRTASAMDVVDYINAGGVIEDCLTGNTPAEETPAEETPDQE